MQIVDNATVRLSAAFNEPSVSVDNSPLTDLDHSNIYAKIGSAPAVSLASVPASAPSGGGAVSLTVLVPAPNGVVTSANFWVTSTDTSGNEGPVSSSVSVSIDRVGPAAPSNFTIA